MSVKTTSKPCIPLWLRLRGRLLQRPRLCFGLMLGCLLLSLGLSLFWDGRWGDRRPVVPGKGTVLHQGYDQVLSNAQSLSGILQLQEEVNQLMIQPVLTREDSLRLLEMCERLEGLNKQLISTQK